MSGCAGDEEAELRRRAPAEVTPRALPELRGRRLLESYYDAEGALRPSTVVVAGLVLPMGFVPSASSAGRRHRFRSDLPVEEVQAYFGPMLVTGEVKRIGSGAVFVNAYPRNARGSVVRLDVGVHPRSGGGSTLEIFERMPPGAAPLPPPASEAAEGAQRTGR